MIGTGKKCTIPQTGLVTARELSFLLHFCLQNNLVILGKIILLSITPLSWWKNVKLMPENLREWDDEGHEKNLIFYFIWVSNKHFCLMLVLEFSGSLLFENSGSLLFWLSCLNWTVKNTFFKVLSPLLKLFT